MTTIEHIAQILADDGHLPDDVKYYIQRLQDTIAMHTLAAPDRTQADRQGATARLRAMREGRTVEELLGKQQQG